MNEHYDFVDALMYGINLGYERKLKKNKLDRSRDTRLLRPKLH